jgi:hypothetical protein
MTKTAAPLSLTSDIIAYESGELDEEDTIILFQKLVDNGMAWSLQGHYGRTAAGLIEAGLVDTPRTQSRDER